MSPKAAIKEVAKAAEAISSKRLASQDIAYAEASGKLKRKVRLVDREGKPTGATATAADVLRKLGEVAPYDSRTWRAYDWRCHGPMHAVLAEGAGKRKAFLRGLWQ